MASVEEVLQAIEKFDAKNDKAHETITVKLDSVAIAQARQDERLKAVEVSCKDNSAGVEALKPVANRVKLLYAGLGLVITSCAGFVIAVLKNWISIGGGT